jgi:hypothetical protein
MGNSFQSSYQLTANIGVEMESPQILHTSQTPQGQEIQNIIDVQRIANNLPEAFNHTTSSNKS